MKLKDLEIFVVGNPPPGWGGKYFTFVKLVTDNGLVGYGEVYAGSISPHVVKIVIKDIFERYMKNENPENIEYMFRRTYSSGFSQRPDLTIMGCFSGLEIACWDIIGKNLDKPIYALLGGSMQKKIRSYTYLYPLPHHDTNKFWSDPQMAEESALEMIKLGFNAIKFDPAGPYTITSLAITGGELNKQLQLSVSKTFVFQTTSPFFLSNATACPSKVPKKTYLFPTAKPLE